MYLFILKRAKAFLSLSISFFLCCLFWTVLHIFEPRHIFNCKVEALPWTAWHGSRALNLVIFPIARLNRCHGPRGTVQEQSYFQLQGWTSLCNFEPREWDFFNGFLVVEINFSCWKSNMFFSKHFQQLPEVPAPFWLSSLILGVVVVLVVNYWLYEEWLFLLNIGQKNRRNPKIPKNVV